MLKYKIVTASFDEQIEKEINSAIADGWKPLGGIQFAVIDQYFNIRYCQAMIRNKEENSKRIKRRSRILQEMSSGIDQALDEYAEED